MPTRSTSPIVTAEASRAWLAFARTCADDRKRDAFVRAAQSADKAGDFLGVLFIERTAVGSGAESRIRPIADAARATLGLEEHAEESLIERLSRAETQCEEIGVHVGRVGDRERVA